MQKSTKPKNKTGRSNARKSRGSGSRLPLFTTTGPSAVREVLAYHQTGSLSEAVPGGGAFNTFRLNSIYDPDFTGVGSSALGYAAKALFYGRYKVMRARYSLRIWGSSGGNALVGTLVGGNTVLAASPSNWAVEPHSVSLMTQGNTGAQHSIVVIDRTVNFPVVLGITKQQFDADLDYQAAFGTNPQLGVYLTAWLYGQAGVAQTVIYDLRVSFDTEFSQPLQSIV